jgi:hypothetical protein
VTFAAFRVGSLLQLLTWDGHPLPNIPGKIDHITCQMFLIRIRKIKVRATAKIPLLRPSDFATVDHNIVIVERSNKVVAEPLKKKQT